MSIVLNGTGGTITGVPGQVLQIVQGSTSSRVQITSNSYADTNLTATITPSSTSSKILILISQNIGSYCSDNSGVEGDLQIVRNSTSIFTSLNVINARAGLGASGELRVAAQHGFTYLDSPSTTSSTTYKTQIKMLSGNGRIEPQSYDGNSTSTIMLLEIAA
jgi:hypothetical protein